jgi:hypothetical protein
MHAPDLKSQVRNGRFRAETQFTDSIQNFIQGDVLRIEAEAHFRAGQVDLDAMHSGQLADDSFNTGGTGRAMHAAHQEANSRNRHGKNPWKKDSGPAVEKPFTARLFKNPSD